jgi:hypothetical protein
MQRKTAPPKGCKKGGAFAGEIGKSRWASLAYGTARRTVPL